MAETPADSDLVNAKTRLEIQKLEVELIQLRSPWKYAPFYFSTATTLLSVIAVIVAFYGLGVESKVAKIEVAELREKEKELKADLKKQRDDLVNVSRITNAAMLIALQGTGAGDLEDFLLQELESELESDATQTLLDSELESDTTRTLLAQTHRHLEHLVKSIQYDYEFIASLLTHRDIGTKKLSAVLLSRLDQQKLASNKKLFADRLLATLLSETDYKMRRFLARAMGKLGEHSTRQLLDALAIVRNDNDRLDLTRALGELRLAADDEVIESLRKQLGRMDKTLQHQTAWSLGKIGVKAHAAGPTLIGLLSKASDIKNVKRSDPHAYLLSREIISTLGRIYAGADPQSIPRDCLSTMKEFFAAEDDDILNDLLIAIGRIGTAAKETLPGVLMVIEKRAETGALGLRRRAATALGRIGAIEKAIELLDAPDARKRRLGALALASVTNLGDEVQQALRKTMEDSKDEELRKRLIAALGDNEENADVVAPMLQKWLKEETSDRVKGQIVRSLGFMAERKKSRKAALKALMGIDVADTNVSLQFRLIEVLERVSKVDSEVVSSVVSIVLKIRDNAKDTAVQLAANAASFRMIKDAHIELEREGVLTTNDRRDSDDKYYKEYAHTFERGFIYEINVTSKDFDTFLYLKKGNDTIAFDDDGGEGLNARYHFEPKKGEEGQYVVWATSFRRNTVGTFRLEIRKTKIPG